MKVIYFLLCFVVVLSDPTLRKFYNLIDTNGDSTLSFQEIVKALEKVEESDITPELRKEIQKDSLIFLNMIFKNNKTSFENFEKSFRSLNFPKSPTEPQQLHLAITGKKDEMKVMWATKKPTKSSVVKYGIEGLNLLERGFNFTYFLPYPHDTDTWLHVVVLKNLRPGVKYTYRVGDEDGGWSKDVTFKTEGSKFPFSLALVGDMGIIPYGLGVSKFVADHFEKKPFDMHIILGDVSYADFGSNGRQESQALWDLFQNQVEPYAKQAPYMVVSGNHEQALADTPLNYTAFSVRFQMPTNGVRNQYYSYDYGGVHFLSMNTETEYESYVPGTAQYKWIEDDLIKAVRNRENVPWIFFMGHRAMYDFKGGLLKNHIEPLMVKYKVDIALWGHIHCYYRTWPVIDEKPVQTYPGNVYLNPTAPVHLMIGTGGARIASNELCGREKPAHVASMHLHYGFGRLEVINETSLHFEFHRWTNQKVEDEFWIHKTNKN